MIRSRNCRSAVSTRRGQRRLVLDGGGRDRDVPRRAGELARDGGEHRRIAAPGPPISTTAGSASATTAESTPATARATATIAALPDAQERRHVDRGRAGAAQAERGEDVRQPHRRALPGPTVTTWAISPASPAWPRRTSPSLTTAQPRPSPRNR